MVVIEMEKDAISVIIATVSKRKKTLYSNHKSNKFQLPLIKLS